MGFESITPNAIENGVAKLKQLYHPSSRVEQADHGMLKDQSQFF